MHDVTIRPATPADAEALAALHLDVWDDAYTGLIAQSILDERRTRVDSRVERWRAILSQEHGTLVAVHLDPADPADPADSATEGALVGFASSGAARDNDMDVDLELWALYVRRPWWGRGIGLALLEATLGDRAAYLWVLAGNDRAIGFYRRQGFALDGTEDEHDEGRHLRMVRAGT